MLQYYRLNSLNVFLIDCIKTVATWFRYSLQYQCKGKWALNAHCLWICRSTSCSRMFTTCRRVFQCFSTRSSCTVQCSIQCRCMLFEYARHVRIHFLFVPLSLDLDDILFNLWVELWAPWPWVLEELSPNGDCHCLQGCVGIALRYSSIIFRFLCLLFAYFEQLWYY